jgi:hypothetical protein
MTTQERAMIILTVSYNHYSCLQKANYFIILRD